MAENAWLETILNKNINDNSVAKVLNVSNTSVAPDGANYASNIYRATLDVLLRSGRKSKISIIIKKDFEDEEKAKMIDETMFKAEIKFYSSILDKYEQLMDDYQDNRDKLWCNMIGCEPYKTIVFEDLKAENFVMADRTKFQDRNHALLVLNSLGRFHAMGYILKKQGLVSKEDFETYLQEKDSPFNDNLIVCGLRKLCDTIESEWPPEWKDIAKRLRKQEKVAVQTMKSLFKTSEPSFHTVCHGDVWTCNMMFKYCSYDEKIPIAIKFVDLQTPHLNSYGFDIMCYMYLSVGWHVRTTYWNEMITEYHRSLKSTLAFYGMETDSPTLDQIHSELKRLDYYGFIMNIAIMPITIAEGKFDVEKLSDDKEAESAFNIELFNNDYYKAAVQPLLKKYYEVLY